MTDHAKILSSLFRKHARIKSLSTPIFVAQYRYAYREYVVAKMTRPTQLNQFERLMEAFKAEAQHRHIKGIFEK